MNKYTLKIFMICLTLLLVAAAQPALGSDWAQFQKDKVHNGVTGDSAPIASPNTTASWAYDIGGAIDTPPIVYGDYVYAIASDGTLAKDYKNGTAAAGWSVDFGSPGFQNAAAAAGNGHIFVVNTGYGSDPNPDLIAVNAIDGSYSDSESVIASIPIQFSTPVTYAEDSSGKKHILFGSVNMSSTDPVNLSDGGRYYCYNVTDPTNLVKEWERNCSSAKGYYWAGAAIIGDYAVLGDDGSHLVSVNYTNVTGSQVQTVNETNVSAVFGFNAKEIRSSIAYSADTGRIYFTSKAGYCYAIGFNASTGQFNTSDKWSSYIGSSTSTPAYYNGRIYVGSSNGLCCLKESDGSSIWTDSVGLVQSSPAVSTFYGPGNEYIYVTTNAATGGIYCVNSNGGTVWNETSMGSNRYSLAGAAVSGGWVFYGNDGGYLHGRANWTRYDFNVRADTDKWAYEGGVSSLPNNPGDPSTVIGNYNNIKATDSTYEDYAAANNYSAAQRFNFNIGETSPNTLNVTWIGKGTRSGANGATLYIWNGTGYQELANSNSASDVVLTGEITSSTGNYVNEGNVTIFVKQKGTTAGALQSKIWTDYVKLVVTL